jgi:hypothetical protein
VQLEFRGADGQTHTQGSRLSPRLVLFLELAQDLGVEPFNGRMLALELRVQDAALVAALVEQLAATVPGLQIGIPSWAQQAPVWAYSASLRQAVAVGMVLYSVATVAWALWQLYHNSEALHAVFSPLVDAVYARLYAINLYNSHHI